MTCRCGVEHPTNLEQLACDEVCGGRVARLTAPRRAALNAAPDEAWEAALEVAHERHGWGP